MKTNKTHSTNFRTAFIVGASLAWIALIAAWVWFITGCSQTAPTIENPPPAVQMVGGAK